MLTFEVNITVFLLFFVEWWGVSGAQYRSWDIHSDVLLPCVAVVHFTLLLNTFSMAVRKHVAKWCKVIYKHVVLENTVNYVYNSHAQTKNNPRNHRVFCSIDLTPAGTRSLWMGRWPCHMDYMRWIRDEVNLLDYSVFQRLIAPDI